VARPPQVEVTVLRVFCDEEGQHGNPLGVVLDGPSVAEDDRQALARHLGYSETVFVDDASEGRIRIFTPEVELPFAGHPCVGTAWMLRRQGFDVDALRAPAGKIPVRFEDEMTYIAGRPEWSPPFQLRRVESPDEVEGHEVITDAEVYLWAWIDERVGTVRARSFVPEVGVEEDEATGSAAVMLAGALEREVTIHQGVGSLLHARPIGDGLVEVGGRVVPD
jgi:predicted PhzF superfamily epimerase YddE/YHI9